MPYAEVALAVQTPFPQAFTYRVPVGMALCPGAVVIVPFGRQTLPGIVLRISEHSGYEGETRDVALAGETVLLPHQVALARWLADRYLASIHACVALMLPPDAGRRLREIVEWTGVADPPDLSAADARLLERLRASGRATPATLRRSFGGPTDAAIARLTAMGAVRRTVGLADPPSVAAVAPVMPVPPTALTAAQQEAAAAVSAAVQARRPEVFLLHGVTGSGKTEVYLAAIDAARATGRRAIVLVPEIALTPQTIRRVAARFPGEVAVSHSGMTPAQRYRQWHDVRAGRCTVVVGARSALFLPQPNLGLIVLDEEHDPSYKQQDPEPRYHARDAARQLAALTGAPVVLASATPDVVSYARAERGRYTLLSLPERVTGGGGWGLGVGGWNGTEGTSVTGPHRPAPSPKSGPLPPAPSPDIGRGGWGPKGEGLPPTPDPRPPTPSLPPVLIVDLAAELRAGNRGIFSRALDGALTTTLRNGEQAILFLNRRGAASFLLCRDCGHAPRCAGCDVPFTYHADPPRLRCHHCGRSRRVPDRCLQCSSARIRQFGLGTQRVEEEVRARYPTARVLRWDRDTVRTGADHEAILTAFATRQADVLVGTQMVTKGLDLPGVTLVGVVSADVALNLPDFRAGERAFQLLTQVAGRAGRGDRPGRVIVQTYSPGHHAIRAAAAHDYAALYRAEMAVRRRAGYPPFGRLARLVYAHTNAGRAEQEARRLAAELRSARDRLGIPGVEIVGPAPALQSRLRGRWRWQIILRAADPAELLRAIDRPRDWAVDIDPVYLG